MDELLMLYGETRHCPDCAAETIFVPVEDPELTDPAYACTACDAAMVLPRAA